MCETALSSISCGNSVLIDEKEIKKITFLSQNEVQAISNFFSVLGKSDEKNQRKQTETYEKMFFDFFENAKEEYKNKGTLFGKLGIYTGLFVSILFL